MENKTPNNEVAGTCKPRNRWKIASFFLFLAVAFLATCVYFMGNKSDDDEGPPGQFYIFNDAAPAVSENIYLAKSIDSSDPDIFKISATGLVNEEAWDTTEIELRLSKKHDKEDEQFKPGQLFIALYGEDGLQVWSLDAKSSDLILSYIEKMKGKTEPEREPLKEELRNEMRKLLEQAAQPKTQVKTARPDPGRAVFLFLMLRH